MNDLDYKLEDILHAIKLEHHKLRDFISRSSTLLDHEKEKILSEIRMSINIQIDNKNIKLGCNRIYRISTNTFGRVSQLDEE